MNSKKYIISSAVLLIVFVLLGSMLVRGGEERFKFGLDLVGGTELVYEADTENAENVSDAMEGLKEVVERRVNIFGVSEPLVQTESAGIISGNREERLIVELPGVASIEEAVELIGATPVLEFRLLRPGAEAVLESNPNATADEIFAPTGLTGSLLSRARVEFNPNTGAPVVGLSFNKEGAELFRQLTERNKGEVLAIILDGAVLSTPVIQDTISDGEAQITGVFSPEEVKELVRNLNYGALPVPISLATSQVIGATLGASALDASISAGLIGFVALSLYLVLWYRLPGLISVVALASYVVLSLWIFRLIPVTLTAAGLAGFILSIGMAVDANVLIFERTKEELKKGRSIREGLHEGFSRAWLSIRDSNISSIITAILLFWLGTSAVKGFALTLGVGVAVSMFTAITVSRTFLFAISPSSDTPTKKFLFSNGFHK